MSDESPQPPDLAAIDLSLSFAPAWAKEADASKQIARLAAKHGGGEERGDRGGTRRDYGDRPRDRGEDRRPRGDRPPPRDGGGNRPGGRPAGGGKRPERGDSRDDRDRRPERSARPERTLPPALHGWEIQFLPDRRGVEGLARQIKAAAKAYPLFDLARLVLEKSERYLVEFKRKAEDATPLFLLKTDGSLWLSEAEAVRHALTRHVETFYRRERVSVDPPKGAYPFVAVCGMSGVLLGPPNYHDYQEKVRRIHAERFAHLPFEAYKGRIRMDRDEESIAKWKEEQSARDVFHPIKEEPTPTATAEESVPAASAPAPVEESAEPVAMEAPAAETAGNESEPEAVAEAVVVTVPAPADEASPAEETAGPAGDPASPPPEEAPALADLAEVERHFREHHAGRLIVKIRDRVVAPGPAALNDSAPAVLELTRGAWEQLSRFPLPLAHGLGQQLVGRGLHIFKAHENITYVSVARPKYLDRTASPVSEGLSGILDYLESHADVPRAEQVQVLVSLRGPSEESAEGVREAAVAKDLSWLLHEGHVVDFIKRGLEAARRPKPPTPPKVRPLKSAPRPGAAAALPVPSTEPGTATVFEPAPAAAQAASAQIAKEEAPASRVAESTPMDAAVTPETMAPTPETPIDGPTEETTLAENLPGDAAMEESLVSSPEGAAAETSSESQDAEATSVRE